MVHGTETIVRRKLSHEVFDRLKGMITSGELGPGDAMPSERDLMDRFGVGRPAIREAMQALANIGLISITHGERAKVQQLTAKSLFQQMDLTATILLSASPDSLEHLKQARRFFERGMVREAAIRSTSADIARLQATLDQQRRAVDDPVLFISADMRFHNQIAAISGNAIFEAVSEAMLGWLRQYHTEMLSWTGKENLTLVEHDEILRHLAQHNADAAEAAMVKHLDRSNALYAHPA
ncbi:transcriptional regulator NanR [Ancylobacter sp. 6x-1]|uniref:Transcriptional regulator NanR n=1 Tax=Ancylobacter crimeensis TaxID=2579147 RepID=A0ABT0D837_9HYPH|nr:transcriptional regulator NanR [Ancylobacter crimeensis]MCK0196113.1 transcriptional regulator NanR [Ancylobacter crimeensis]